MTDVKELITRISRPAWRDVALLISAFTLFASIWIFAVVADQVLEGDLHEMEQRWMLALRSPENPSVPVGPDWLRSCSLDLTSLGSAAVLTLMTLLVAGYLLLVKRYGAVLLLLAATLGGTCLSYGLKNIFGRDRPSVISHLEQVTSPSFPSGHTMLASVVYLTLGVMLSRSVKSRWLRAYYISAAFLLALLVGLTRVYLGVHYPTDVVAGWAVGTAWAILCAFTAYWLQRRGAVEPPVPSQISDHAR